MALDKLQELLSQVPQEGENGGGDIIGKPALDSSFIANLLKSNPEMAKVIAEAFEKRHGQERQDHGRGEEVPDGI